ncbi:hypothetical protein [Deinococcus sp. QL22]|uniref:hypothetical protein n=1 Tax=Deinococcus sp. QL22 TaxID=2939437 RepID=UPI0020180069|nr:hypothetical protein [Deinococcus sp. QL22]UQN05475.1 hypothetical protein M1R55_11375 [Deinococcus sp. QL22]
MWPTITALQYQGVEVTCWIKDGQWALQGQLEGDIRRTEPAPLLTAHSVDELWHLMQALMHERRDQGRPQ